jgi:hypothetical protein
MLDIRKFGDSTRVPARAWHDIRRGAPVRDPVPAAIWTLYRLYITNCSVRALPLDACRNEDHKVEKYVVFFSRILTFFFFIVYNTAWSDEFDVF